MTRLYNFHLFISLQHVLISGVLSASFTLTNNCTYTVWPGVYTNLNKEAISPTGFVLQRGESKTLSIPNGWNGRFWGRTHCTVDSFGNFVCGTGDCGSGKLECTDTAAQPVTLVEFGLNVAGRDFYDVSLVDGFNLPVLVVPQGRNGSCSSTGCVADLNAACPSELRVPVEGGNEIMACRSACQTFGGPLHCCGRIYGTNCTTTSYSQFFKEACPRAYSNQFDDTNSTFSCPSTAYVITFCPTIGSEKPSSNGGHSNASKELPLVNNTMVSMDGDEASHALPRFQHGQFLALAIAVLGASWPLPLF